MALTVQILDLKQVEGGTEITYLVDGVHRKGQVFANKAAAQQFVQDHAITDEDLFAMALRTWFARDPSLTLSNITARVMTLDYTINNVVRITLL